jgi:hypothetical protein
MPRKKCAYGFSCADMLMQPGLEPEDCPNAATCGTITSLSERERAELQIARMQNNRRIVEAVRITPNWAAIRLLNSRGCPQTTETIGVDASLANLSSAIERCRAELNELSTGYVAPIGVEAHRYLVKRPGANYQYNKLTSKDPLFPPQVKDQKVKTCSPPTPLFAPNLLYQALVFPQSRELLQISIAISTSLFTTAQGDRF